MPFWKKKDNLIISAVVVLFFVGLIWWQEMGAVRAALPGAHSSALNVSFFDKDQKSHTLAEFKGKPFILNFWATWCPVCVNKMSTLNQFAKKFEAKGGRVVTVSEDNHGFEKVKEYHARNKYDNLPIFLDNNGSLMNAYSAQGLPTAIFFNAKGEEMGRIAGGIDWESPEVQEMVHSYLGILVK